MKPAVGDLVPISVVGAMTGVNPVTLRAWERRYGLLQPHRTAKGYRLYSDDDVARVRHIVSWLDKGVAISRVRPLLEGTLPGAAASETADASQDQGQAARDWQEALDAGVQAAMALDVRRLEQQFNRLAGDYPLSQVLACWADPLSARLLAQSGSGSTGVPGMRSARIAFDDFLHNKLAARLLMAGRRAGRQPRWVVLPAADGADREAQTLAALCAEADLPVLLLSTPLPADELSLLGSRADVAGVLLVLPPGTSTTSLERRLGTARRHLAERLFACGDGLLTLSRIPSGVSPLAGPRQQIINRLAALSSTHRKEPV
ncbi:MerR family transcriptional regulator [Alcanivorax limicola]|uniref:MerR family transcriptional regulator n=1 Tax=Alcanivorax limicola TaxID=2874102 RepID=UPI001CBE02FB|nr:MerR family transcriptional regulator [Alcanivorax limicola]